MSATPALPVLDAYVGRADAIPVAPPRPVITVAPIEIVTAGRAAPLQARLSAPVSGADLPVVLVSHGGGSTNYLSSLRGLTPLTDFWASRGFAVVQPTHLSSPSLGLPRMAPDSREYWESRVRDLTDILDHLDLIEAVVPGLAGRLDRSRIAVAGHSMGGQTASMLLGAEFIDEDATVVRPIDARVTAGILLAPTGSGPDGLTDLAKRYTCLRTASFGRMTTPTLTVIGDRDDSPELSHRGPEYHADPFTGAPGPAALATLTGGEHMLGGITGYDTVETTDEDPERVAVIQRLTWAFLASRFQDDAEIWERARDGFDSIEGIGRIDSK